MNANAQYSVNVPAQTFEFSSAEAAAKFQRIVQKNTALVISRVDKAQVGPGNVVPCLASDVVATPIRPDGTLSPDSLLIASGESTIVLKPKMTAEEKAEKKANRLPRKGRGRKSESEADVEADLETE